ERDGDGLYRGGPLFATYASRFDRVENLVAAADPTLQRLSEETGETVNLAVPGPNGVVQVAQVDSTFVLGATNWADVEVPPHCSGLGKLKYADADIPQKPEQHNRRTQHTLGPRSDLTNIYPEDRERRIVIAHDQHHVVALALKPPQLFNFAEVLDDLP